MQTAFLIDGFNFYHSIEPLEKRIRWFDYHAYCKHFMRKDDLVQSITYFTALAYWRGTAAKRHQIFIEANEANGIKVVLGKFKEKTYICPHCKQNILRHEEKATDVNIALYAYRMASMQVAEQIVLVTGDTDLIPSVKMIKKDCPAIRIGVIFPFKRFGKELKQEAHFSHKTDQNILHNFQLPDEIIKPNGGKITRPIEWR
jgi:uncharacterized LabA/DUF88 family protein